MNIISNISGQNDSEGFHSIRGPFSKQVPWTAQMFTETLSDGWTGAMVFTATLSDGLQMPWTAPVLTETLSGGLQTD